MICQKVVTLALGIAVFVTCGKPTEHKRRPPPPQKQPTKADRANLLKRQSAVRVFRGAYALLFEQADPSMIVLIFDNMKGEERQAAVKILDLKIDPNPRDRSQNIASVQILIAAVKGRFFSTPYTWQIMQGPNAPPVKAIAPLKYKFLPIGFISQETTFGWLAFPVPRSVTRNQLKKYWSLRYHTKVFTSHAVSLANPTLHQPFKQRQKIAADINVAAAKVEALKAELDQQTAEGNGGTP